MNELENKVLRIVNRNGQLCLGTGWVVEQAGNFGMLTLRNIATGETHEQAISHIKRWLREGDMVAESAVELAV